MSIKSLPLTSYLYLYIIIKHCYTYESTISKIQKTVIFKSLPKSLPQVLT